MKALVVDYLPWIISIFTVVHTILVGNKSLRGWVVAMFGQVLWSVWVVTSATWGLLPLNIVLWGIYIRNYIRWRSGETEHQQLLAAQGVIKYLEDMISQQKRDLRDAERKIIDLSMDRRNLSAEVKKAHDVIAHYRAAAELRREEDFVRRGGIGQALNPTPASQTAAAGTASSSSSSSGSND